MNTLLSAGHRAGTTALQVARADAAAWGRTLESTARTVVAVAVGCFVAGEALGRWVHQLNDALAAAFRCLLAGHQAAEAAVTAAAEVIEPAATAAVELVEQATGLPLACHSVVELRTLARERLGSAARIGDRRIAQARRNDLLAALA